MNQKRHGYIQQCYACAYTEMGHCKTKVRDPFSYVVYRLRYPDSTRVYRISRFCGSRCKDKHDAPRCVMTRRRKCRWSKKLKLSWYLTTWAMMNASQIKSKTENALSIEIYSTPLRKHRSHAPGQGTPHSKRLEKTPCLIK